MKGPEYVYQTVRAYREAIDRHLENKPFDATADAENFRKIFNRGFTKGWLLGERGDDYLTSEVPGNQGIPVARINAWDARAEEIEIELLETLSVGDELQLRKDRESSGCRVEYIISRGQRVKDASKGTKVRINYKVACQPGDILRRTYDKIEMERIRAMIHADARRIPVSLHAVLRVGAPVEVVLTDDLGHQGSAVSEARVETALKRPLDHARVSEQLTKLGSTAYVAETVEIEMDDNIMVSVKVLNEARRMAAEALDQARLKRESLAAELRGPSSENSPMSGNPDIIAEITQSPDYEDHGLFEDEENEEDEDNVAEDAFEFDGSESRLLKTPITLCASVPDLGRLHLTLEGGMKEVYFRGPLKDYEAARTLGNRYGARIAWQWTRPNPTRMLERSAETLLALKPEALVVSSPGMIPWAKTFTEHVIADYGLNVLNLRTAKVVEQLGADVVTLSPELTAAAMGRMGHQVGSALEIVGYGHLPVMITPHCPIRTSLGGPAEGCALCTGKYYGLKDKTGAIFPVRKVGPCWTEILNSRVLDLSEYFEMLMSMGVTRYRLHFTIESPDDILRTVAAHIARAKGESVAITTQMPRTRGHFYRGVK
jgi:putative protease